MYKVHIRNRWLRFETLRAAQDFCEQIFQTTRIVLTIVEVKKNG
jgi:hypothetical protein